MLRVTLYVLFLSSALSAGIIQPAHSQTITSTEGAGAPGAMVLPAGTKVEMALVRPVWAQTAKACDPIYAQTVFPVTIAGQIGIPAGTYVSGKINAVTRPTWKLQQSLLQLEFTKIVLADGYTIALGEHGTVNSVDPVSNVTVKVTTANDLLLDNGAQVEMTLANTLALDAARVAQALPLSRAPSPASFRSATLCRWTPGYPGAPGTTGTPGAPTQVIPGAPGTLPTYREPQALRVMPEDTVLCRPWWFPVCLHL
jgi:hypothetical protein